ncbi:cytochrome c maturation protein CcmE [Polycladidibacter stylochi]|uniref:cytochrome c maturation protein CcmE n=1 Tax=Polycladidibacter stylochi TaxID=1807766 RepID=UPI00082E9C63|nr:cytochrome c maturation protein CcmE [Pseudovibrio stylochi]
MTRKQRRLSLIAVAGVVLACATALVLYALKGEVSFFLDPSQIVTNRPAPDQRIRLGGLVETGSVKRDQGETIEFRVTDGEQEVAVTFTGILPDLFREGQGIVAEGYVNPQGVFVADQVLAKHDENYMPKEVADSLKKQGHWKDEYQNGS